MPRLADDPLSTPRVLRSDRPQSDNATGNWRSLRPSILLERCTRCLLCWKFCPEACVQLVDGAPRIQYEYCKGCGICAAECPPRAVVLAQEEEGACAKS
ncbi:MAG: 4Fe-4S binding protein [Elusimicrobia bacterium]|nr:4Fe-4S binding protein [Elusimicrobiota bacterium]